MVEEKTAPTIAVINHGMGNWRSVQRALMHVGADAPRTQNPEEILRADGLVLPGVGSFQYAMGQLAARGLVDTINKFHRLGKPILGICLGHQMLFEASEERGLTRGFGFLSGAVRQAIPGPTDIVSIGWRTVGFTDDAVLNQGGKTQENFYHLHAYAAVPDDKSVICALSSFGAPKHETFFVVGAVQLGNIYGMQFHPEKSSEQGLGLLKNFVRVCDEEPVGI